MAVQGRPLNEAKVARIRHLLFATEMSIPEIAIRMDCSRSAIVVINRRFGIRSYRRSRAQWQLCASACVDASVKANSCLLAFPSLPQTVQGAGH
jgi:hypothetical protein